jgi:DNA-binding FrmR family transcriptional regulator
VEGQHEHVVHYERDKEGILERLRKVEGQVRGIQRMVEEDRYCVDILTQVAAVRAALDKVGLMLLEGHTRGCVVRAIRENHGDAAIQELMEVVQKFIK